MAALSLVLAATGCDDSLPPWAEALVVIDTDAPVPQVVNRVRVDLYDADGVWFDSRDLARPDPRDWPVSFSVYSDDEAHGDRFWVRARAYPEGRVRDYRGERYRPWGGALVDVAGDGEPRLLREGEDVTPSTEPEPLAAIDQLVLVELEPGVRGRLVITLNAVCAGTMPRLAADATTCIDEPKRAEPVTPREVERDELAVTPIDKARPGCAGEAPAGAVCIPGGAALMGSTELGLYPDLEPRPERLVVHSPFFIDRFEVTVGRLRAALAAGFAPAAMPIENLGPVTGDVAGSCTWSPTDLGREGYGLACVSWQTARELCQWSGGDLPTEAQLEHAATLASDFGRSRYPWGDEPPTCERASYGRLALAGFPGVCQNIGSGPEPIDGLEMGDVTRQGVIGLAGGLTEWMRDDYLGYTSACWGDSPIVDPRCEEPFAAEKALRGGSWAAPPTILPSAARLGTLPSATASFIGFRCVYPVEER